MTRTLEYSSKRGNLHRIGSSTLLKTLPGILGPFRGIPSWTHEKLEANAATLRCPIGGDHGCHRGARCHQWLQNNGKSSGTDEIRNAPLKNLTYRALKCLVSVINGALTLDQPKDLEVDTTMPTHLNTDYQLLLMKDANGFSRREIFLDLTRAFDTVWREDVVFKSACLHRHTSPHYCHVPKVLRVQSD